MGASVPQLTDRPRTKHRSALPSRAGFWRFGFGVNPQGVGDAIGVVEVGNHLDGVQVIAVREPMLAAFNSPVASSGSTIVIQAIRLP